MQSERITASVTLYRATYGCPADVVIKRAGTVQVESFGVGHVFTDNANAVEFANRMAATFGVAVEFGDES